MAARRTHAFDLWSLRETLATQCSPATRVCIGASRGSPSVANPLGACAKPMRFTPLVHDHVITWWARDGLGRVYWHMWGNALGATLPNNPARRRTAGENLHVRELAGEFSPGNALPVTIEPEHTTEVFTGFGEKGVSAESVPAGAEKTLACLTRRSLFVKATFRIKFPHSFDEIVGTRIGASR